ncbi:MAG TPA: aminotransferase class V-fold PLP-dependent enzyme [Dehalococcoidia bacterium]|nr:aminotransferase class V-fold PLP-dependent enzyme [Dehalococcoidia bacterium]
MTVETRKPLLSYREQFPILSTSTYLINNSLGAMPASVHTALRDYATLWENEGVAAWHDWMPMVQEVGDLVGRVIGAPKGTVLMHQSVSSTLSIIASCFDWKPPRNKVIYTSNEFPTVDFFWDSWQKLGARAVRIDSGDKHVFPLEQVLEAIDHETLIVSISHVLFRSSAIVDVRAVVERAHEMGAYVLVDAYQSVASMPIDVVDWDVDFLSGGSVKWLCGGSGAGYLYVRSDLIEQLEPAVCGWLSHVDPFAFEEAPIRYAPGIIRFLGGTPAMPGLYAAREGYRIIDEVGTAAIRANSVKLTRPLINWAQEKGLALRTPPDDEARGGHVTVDMPNCEEVSKRLLDRRFFVDYRPGSGIRISPHFFNTPDEVDSVIRQIDSLLGG